MDKKQKTKNKKKHEQFYFFFQYMKFIVKLVSIQHPVLIPKGALLNTHYPPSPPSHPHQPSVYSHFLRVSYALALSHPNLFFFFFSSPPPWVPVKFLRIHIRVNTYGICLSLYSLFHLASHSPVPATLLQKAIFHSFSLPRSTPLCI